MSTNQTIVQSTTTSRDLALNELNSNYKKFIEKSLIESILLEIVNSTRAQTDDNYRSIAKYDERLLERYLNILNDLSQTMELFDVETKTYLSNKFDYLLETRMKSIYDLVNDSDILELNDKLNSEPEVKYDHCMNVSIEVSNLIKEMLNTYRIDFYLKENKLKSEHKLTECETLFAKIRTVANELVADLYSPEKLNALQTIRNQLDLNSNFSRDKLEQIVESLCLFKSLGKEFEDLLLNYKKLKQQLERKKYSINKLNNKESFLY